LDIISLLCCKIRSTISPLPKLPSCTWLGDWDIPRGSGEEEEEEAPIAKHSPSSSDLEIGKERRWLLLLLLLLFSSSIRGEGAWRRLEDWEERSCSNKGRDRLNM